MAQLVKNLPAIQETWVCMIPWRRERLPTPVFGLVNSMDCMVQFNKSISSVAQLCQALCDLMDYIVHGILQDRILERVAFPFSRGSSQPRIEPRSPALRADSLPAEP